MEVYRAVKCRKKKSEYILGPQSHVNAAHIYLIFDMLHSEHVAKLQHTLSAWLRWQSHSFHAFVVAWKSKMINRPQPLHLMETDIPASNAFQGNGRQAKKRHLRPFSLCFLLTEYPKVHWKIFINHQFVEINKWCRTPSFSRFCSVHSRTWGWGKQGPASHPAASSPSSPASVLLFSKFHHTTGSHGGCHTAEFEPLDKQMMHMNLFTILFPLTLINYVSVCLLSFQAQMEGTASENGTLFLSELSRCSSTEGRKPYHSWTVFLAPAYLSCWKPSGCQSVSELTQSPWLQCPLLVNAVWACLNWKLFLGVIALYTALSPIDSRTFSKPFEFSLLTSQQS